jgi:hypothetical protein
VFRSRWHDASVYAEGSVGYYTNAAVGPILRVGRLRSHFTALTSNPIAAGNQLLAATTPVDSAINYDGPGTPRYRYDEFEFYAYGTVRGRAVLWNSLLEGQFRSNPEGVRISPAELRYGLFEWEFGASVGGWGVNLTLALSAGRSPEYAIDGIATRWHRWGGFYLTYRLPEKWK